MPEEAIHSIDIDPAGTAGAAFLGTKRLQQLERAQDEALSATARIIDAKNARIKELEEALEARLAQIKRYQAADDRRKALFRHGEED